MEWFLKLSALSFFLLKLKDGFAKDILDHGSQYITEVDGVSLEGDMDATVAKLAETLSRIDKQQRETRDMVQHFINGLVPGQKQKNSDKSGYKEVFEGKHRYKRGRGDLGYVPVEDTTPNTDTPYLTDWDTESPSGIQRTPYVTGGGKATETPSVTSSTDVINTPHSSETSDVTNGQTVTGVSSATQNSFSEGVEDLSRSTEGPDLGIQRTPYVTGGGKVTETPSVTSSTDVINTPHSSETSDVTNGQTITSVSSATQNSFSEGVEDLSRSTEGPDLESGIPRLELDGNCYVEVCRKRPQVILPGPVGDQGLHGERGTRGDRGPRGDRGDRGIAGAKGAKGDTGPLGERGSPGEPGSEGNSGIDGLPGSNGDKGEKGEKGNAGAGTTTYTSTLYTRWGSKRCGDNAELVYEGYAAGSHYDQTGGGANYVCLPPNPVYRRPEHGVSTSRAYMYGAEYEVVDFPPFSGKDDGDVPCAVCSATNRTVTLMQPARTECPSGWTQEYYGYLMAQSYLYYRSEWTCVDYSATLTDPSCTANSDGALFYPTEVICGNSGLPCELYTDGYELTCSVCTR